MKNFLGKTILILKVLISFLYLQIVLPCNTVLGEVLLHTTFDCAEAVEKPEIVSRKVSGIPVSLKTSGSGSIVFENSKFGRAVRLHGDLKNNELITISARCIDFSKSGRMDFWIKFNRNPHNVEKEFYIFFDSNWPINFQIEVIPYNSRQSNFAVWLGARERGISKQLFVASGDRYHPNGPWSKIKKNEWHRITLKWWKHIAKDDELRLYIDGLCNDESMYDLTGRLPEKRKWKKIYIGGNKYGVLTNDFSVDELWIFDDPDDSPENYGFKR